MTQDNQDKQNFLLTMLAEGDATVCLDARQPDVDVPQAHQSNPMLNLVLSLKFRHPIEVLEEGIYGTLLFGGRPHKCAIPFTAVWAIYEPDSQKGQVWEASIPDDIDWGDQVGPAGASSADRAGPKSATRKATTSGKPDKPKRDRSHLRIIK